MIRPSMLSTMAFYLNLKLIWARRWVRMAFFVLFYLAILLVLVLLYGKGDFSTPPFIYQEY